MTPNGGDREPRVREWAVRVHCSSSKAIRFQLTEPTLVVVLKHYAISVRFAATSALGQVLSLTIIVRLCTIEAQVLDFLVPFEPSGTLAIAWRSTAAAKPTSKPSAVLANAGGAAGCAAGCAAGGTAGGA